MCSIHLVFFLLFYIKNNFGMVQYNSLANPQRHFCDSFYAQAVPLFFDTYCSHKNKSAMHFNNGLYFISVKLCRKLHPPPLNHHDDETYWCILLDPVDGKCTISSKHKLQLVIHHCVGVKIS